MVHAVALLAALAVPSSAVPAAPNLESSFFELRTRVLAERARAKKVDALALQRTDRNTQVIAGNANFLRAQLMSLRLRLRQRPQPAPDPIAVQQAMQFVAYMQALSNQYMQVAQDASLLLAQAEPDAAVVDAAKNLVRDAEGAFELAQLLRTEVQLSFWDFSGAGLANQAYQAQNFAMITEASARDLLQRSQVLLDRVTPHSKR